MGTDDHVPVPTSAQIASIVSSGVWVEHYGCRGGIDLPGLMISPGRCLPSAAKVLTSGQASCSTHPGKSRPMPRRRQCSKHLFFLLLMVAALTSSISMLEVQLLISWTKKNGAARKLRTGE